jgi:hypothetical protein
MYVGLLANKLKHYVEGESILSDVVARWRRLGLPRNEVLARCLFHLAKAKAQDRKSCGRRNTLPGRHRLDAQRRRRVLLQDFPWDCAAWPISRSTWKSLPKRRPCLTRPARSPAKVGEDSSEVALTRLFAGSLA